MTQKSNFVVVSTAVASESEAEALARRIVNERLAACVQYTPIQSIYRWKGAVESASEFLFRAKTRASLADKLIACIRNVHSYEVPEITVTPITGGLKEYLGWIRKETTSDE